MEASFKVSEEKIHFIFVRDEEDNERISKQRFGMSDIQPYIKLGQKCDPNKIHNDLIALAIILMINPFVGGKLLFNFPISKKFLDMTSSVISKYEIHANGEYIEPLKRKNAHRPGLAFSGGADSSAALAVLPKDTCLIFMNRPMRKDSIYDSSAPLEICERLDEIGYDVEVVETDLEYLREPVGFPTDLANSIPAILMSNHLDIDSIAFGTVLESAYGIGHEKFREYGNGAHYRFFSKLFKSIDLELNLPTIGISEVGTAIIGNKSSVGKIQQSCIRGKLFEPCLNCWKCFRKELLNYSLGFYDYEPNFQEMMRSNEVQIKLSSYPISHENVVTFSLQNIDYEESENLKILASKLDMSCNLSFLRGWYAPSIEFVPEKYRYSIREKIIQYLPIMKVEMQDLVSEWNVEKYITSNKAKRGQQRFIDFLNQIS